MRILPTKIHGIIDYLSGILYLALPWLLGFHRGGPSTNVFLVLGVAMLVYSLLTHYELGLLRFIPMRAHLMMDVFGGIILAASPWLLSFADHVFWPHLLLGLFAIAAGLMTHKEPELTPKPYTVPTSE